MSAPEKARRKEIEGLIGQVRRILLTDWDPLGVDEMPSLADEYDFVLGKVMAGLSSATSAREVVDLLVAVERDDLGLPEPRPDLCLQAAESLIQLRLATDAWPNAS
jgi:hypothetical protein